ncbi:hypothetical protein Q6265_30725, partial [Klebsiella pneumoniae]|nr:hypothetical protein [Klebsiella pneumoniae]
PLAAVNACAHEATTALTTVEFPWHDIGVKSGKALLELLNDKPCEKFIEIPSVLKVRAITSA